MRYMQTGGWWDFVDVTHPGYLAGLVLLPLIVALSMRTLAALGPMRRVLVVGVRCLVVIAVSLALAGLEWVRTTDDQTVVFAVDQSFSVPLDARRDAAEFVRAAHTHMRGGKDRVAVLGFAGQASVEQVPHRSLLANRMNEPSEPQRTNVAGALRLGLAVLSADSANRVVLLSDGNENVGCAVEEADAYAALGVPVDVVPLRYEHAAEILVDQLAAPTTARLDEVVNLQLVVRSKVATRARLLLYRNDRLVSYDAADPDAGSIVSLDPGPNRFALPVALRASGVHRFRAVVRPTDPATDALPQNNEGRAFTVVGAAERVLVVVDDATDSTHVNEAVAASVSRALRDGGIDCEQISVDALPSDPAALTDCSTVILENVSAFALGAERQHMLASYVRDHGGGLVVIGGDQAFSVGGYAHTPLEEVLPVETSRDKLNLLGLDMVIVIDRSGSMAGEKIAMARQAAVAAVRMLCRLDWIGVVAFNSAPTWVVPLQPAGDKAAITLRLSTIGAGGDTFMYPALEQAYAALTATKANVKHIIVLTDGQSAPADFETFARCCEAAGITISTIAVGPDADRVLLARLAQLSGGREYVADSARPLPQIFVRETVLASRSGMYEKTFTPTLNAAVDERILTGFAQADIPPLRGHVVTAAKPLAQTPLVRRTEDGADPILAYWQVGLGRTVAFTSGLWPKWGPEWMSWPGFGKVWTQAVRYAGRPGDVADLEVEATVRDGQARVVVLGDPLPPHAQGSLSLAGQVVRPDFSSTPLTVRRTGVTRFEATFPADMPGTYLVDLPYQYGAGGERQTGVFRTGVAVSYAPEYHTVRENEAVLAEVARRTGGRLLSLDYADAVFESSSIRPVQVRRPLWEIFVQIAAALFLVDVAVRRIAIAPAEVVTRIRTLAQEMAGRSAAGGSAATLAALRQQKNRVETGSAEADLGAPAPDNATDSTRERSDVDALTRSLGGGASDESIEPTPARRGRPPINTETEYTARLLRAKRRAHGDNDQSADG